jgi:hypothetical protein
LFQRRIETVMPHRKRHSMLLMRRNRDMHQYDPQGLEHCSVHSSIVHQQLSQNHLDMDRSRYQQHRYNCYYHHSQGHRHHKEDSELNHHSMIVDKHLQTHHNHNQRYRLSRLASQLLREQIEAREEGVEHADAYEQIALKRIKKCSFIV